MFNLLARHAQDVRVAVYREIVSYTEHSVPLCVYLHNVEYRVNWPSRVDLAGPGDLADPPHMLSISA